MSVKNDSREKIIAAASKLFQLKGYNATSINDILKESGTPKGSLYYYFPNGKEELALASIESAAKAITSSVKTSLVKYDNPVKAIQNNINNIIECINLNGKLEDLSLSLLALETYSSNNTLREACKNAFSSLENIYTEKLIQSGLNENNAQQLGSTIQIMIEGAITASVTKGDTSPLTIISRQISILLSPFI